MENKVKIAKIELKEFNKLTLWDKNPRAIHEVELERLKGLISKLGLFKPFLVTEDGIILGGNMRYKACKEFGFDKVPVSIVKANTDQEKLEYALADNDRAGYYEEDKLAELILEVPELDLDDFKVDLGKLTSLPDLLEKFGPYGGDIEGGKLVEEFIVPPFSVLDTKQGYWQDRKRDWLDIGIKSELGRDANLIGYSLVTQINSGTSVFDPVLCELSYKWFNVKNGSVLDPFAGGSVRGIVAEKLGFKYTGIELSKNQVLENRKQAERLELKPNWINGDSNVELDKLDEKFDMVFSCPPYEDLEVYSNDHADISNMSHDDFNLIYKSIIKKAVAKLKDNSFAVWVVSEVRGKNGFYNLLVPNTIKFFEEAGSKFYNEIILVNSIGTLPIRAGRVFQSGRKVGRMHQNVLVFYKGDPNKIKEKFGNVEIGELSTE